MHVIAIPLIHTYIGKYKNYNIKQKVQLLHFLIIGII